MPRAGKIIKRKVIVDPVYQSPVVAHLINRVMYSGKKAIAQKQIYDTFDLIKEKTKEEPLKVFGQALDNIKPAMEVRSRRVGGAAYQIPTPVRSDRRESLAIRWLIQAARARSNKEYHHFSGKLAAEILDALNNQGGAVKKRIDTHKMADANKAFSHFRW
jgi:small subunit ribosomal protein S7